MSVPAVRKQYIGNMHIKHNVFNTAHDQTATMADLMYISLLSLLDAGRECHDYLQIMMIMYASLDVMYS
jgi:hypothetical protein